MAFESAEFDTQIPCDEYDAVYPVNEEFWAWVDSMEQAITAQTFDIN